MTTSPIRVREIRDRLGLSQAQFGQLLGSHWVTVSKWENGHVPLNPYQAGLIDRFGTAAEQGETDLGDAVKAALVTVGVVAAVYLLLKAAFGEEDEHGSRR